RQIVSMFGDDRLELVQSVVVEGQCRSAQLAWYAARIEARKQMTIERGRFTEVRCQVPIRPAMISAERDLSPPTVCARNPDGDRHRFAARTGEPHHLGPRM